MSNRVVITVEKLSKRYRLGETGAATLKEAADRWFRRRLQSDEEREKREIWALRDVSFEVKEGEVLGIIGRNGAGKSTLLKILTRITEPTSGRALLRGRMASLLEVGTGFHPDLTGRENIYLNGAILGMKKAEIERKFDEIVAFAELEKFIDTPVKRYSSGMYVRLAFAVAAHLEPEILLVDEVLAVGDAAFQKKCLGKMGDVARQGRTVLFVSHSMPAIRRVCETAYLLEQGRIVASGNAQMVVNAYLKAIMEGDEEHARSQNLDVPQGAIKFVSWRLAKSGVADLVSDYHTYTGDPCTIILKLVVRRSISSAYFGILISDIDGTRIWVMNTLDYGGEYVSLNEGEYELRFFIPTLPIRPGSYQIYVNANNLEEGRLHEWYAVPTLHVLPKETINRPLTHQGILSMRGEFEVVAVGGTRTQ